MQGSKQLSILLILSVVSMVVSSEAKQFMPPPRDELIKSSASLSPTTGQVQGVPLDIKQTIGADQEIDKSAPVQSVNATVQIDAVRQNSPEQKPSQKDAPYQGSSPRSKPIGDNSTTPVKNNTVVDGPQRGSAGSSTIVSSLIATSIVISTIAMRSRQWLVGSA